MSRAFAIDLEHFLLEQPRLWTPIRGDSIFAVDMFSTPRYADQDT